jgi:molybdate-binding protein
MAGGHIEAARLAATLGCAAVTTEAAARAFGLEFLPLEEHVVQIWLAERWRDHPGVETLGNLLAAAAFTERIAQFGGYDLNGCGSRITARLGGSAA